MKRSATSVLGVAAAGALREGDPGPAFEGLHPLKNRIVRKEAGG